LCADLVPQFASRLRQFPQISAIQFRRLNRLYRRFRRAFAWSADFSSILYFTGLFPCRMHALAKRVQSRIEAV
jgi:hypothetical protein